MKDSPHIQQSDRAEPCPASAATLRLRLLGTTDLHAHLWAHDYHHDRPLDSVGLVRTASLIRQARSETRNCLLFDNGDLIQGSPLGDLARARHGRGQINPVIAAMNALAYDAATLGNHDFNFGLDFALETTGQADFPFVLGNVHPSGGAPETTILPAYALLERDMVDDHGQNHRLCVGVLGLAPPQISQWDAGLLRGRVETSGIVQTARQLVPRLRAKGADIVVVLAHTGIALDSDGAEEIAENAALPLSRTEGVDALFAGHVHAVFPSDEFRTVAQADLRRGTLNGTATAMAGFWGSHLAVIDLELKPNTKGGWNVHASQSACRPVFARDSARRLAPLVADDPEIARIARTAHRDTLRHIRQPIGVTETPLHSYFAQLAPSACMALVAETKRCFFDKELGKSIDPALPVLACATPFKAGGHGGPDYFTDVPQGQITRKSIDDIYLYPNRISALKINGLTLRAWLERAASVYFQVPRGAADAPLLDPRYPSFLFDIVYGVDYEIDLSQPRRFDLSGRVRNANSRRIRNLFYQGAPVRDDMDFILLTNNFRADGGGGYPGGVAIASNIPMPQNYELMLTYIRETGVISVVPRRHWRFSAMPGTSVIYRTSPHARAHLRDIADLSIEDLGDDENGFCQLRIHL